MEQPGDKNAGQRNPEGFLAGGGEMGRLIREKDWSKTPLGPIEAWPQSLRSAISILLPSKAQIAMFWGEDLVTLYNDAYRPVFGAKHPGALGKPIRESWDELWRAGLKELFDGVRQTGEAFWAQDRPFFMERHGYLEETYFDVSYDPVRDESGRVGGVFCIVAEKTGRVLGERRLRTLRDLARVGHHARSVAQVYAAALEVLGRSAEDIPFALLYGAGAPGEAAPLMGKTGEVPASLAWPLGEEPKVLSGAGLDAFGELHGGPWPERIREAAVLPFALPGQPPAGHLVAGVSPRRRLDDDYLDFLRLVASNIASALAAVRRAEDERERAEKLAELDRAKTAFFSNVSHEFRTPLTLMLGPLEDVLLQPASGDHEKLKVVYRNGQRLLKLVNTLLDFSRIEAGRAQASYEATDLAALTADLASSFRSAMEKAGLRLEVDCPALAEPAWVDRDMWEKIVLNLLSNAFKHTFEGGVSVSLSRDDSFIELRVADTGTGIPAAELPRIFERFRRVEGARSRTHEGTGIGLALVQELVKLHCGAVEAESEEGRGSTFRVRIPAGRAHLPPERIGAGRTLASTSLGADAFVEEALRWLPASPARDAARGNRRRIVWADDNADMREYVRGLLAPHYEVEAVADGAEALAAVRRERPDLVLTDVMMPNVDGIELLRRLRADAGTATVPVLVVSARAGEEARIEGLEAGADDYLYKPFSARELLARVAGLLRSADLRAQAARTEEALEESERRLQTLIANLPGMAYRCPTVPPWPLTFASEGVLGLTGRPASAFLAGEANWAGLIHAEDAAAVEAEVAAALEARRPFEMTYRIRHTDGGLRWILDRGRAIYDPRTGEPAAIEGFALDLSRQREAEDALREADRRKDEFLATLAHELRNPLAPLRSALDLLQRTQAPRELDAVRGIMGRQVEHLVRLVDDLLEVSRISRGVLELRRELVPAAAVMRNAAESSRPLVEAKRHHLEVSPPAEPLWLDGDPVRLAQIVSNLLNNAAKYTDPGGRIVLSARREPGGAAIEVRDNGRGIAPEALPRLFEMFNREQRSGETGEEGLGIGLALSQRLAELHGGSLEAHSDGPGQGARFTLRVPLAAPPPGAAEPAPVRKLAPLRARVLVVDDNRDAAETLAMLLRALGAEVRTAFDGPSALRLLGSYEPDVALLDIGMQGMDGYEVARAMRQALPRQPALIALTGWGQEEDRRRAKEAGFDHHLVKPADIGTLQSLFSSLAPPRPH